MDVFCISQLGHNPQCQKQSVNPADDAHTSTWHVLLFFSLLWSMLLRCPVPEWALRLSMMSHTE